MNFHLSNSYRKHLGLAPIEPHWEAVKLSSSNTLYFEGNWIKKLIMQSEDTYYEAQLNEETRNRLFLVPKTQKGEEKKLSLSTLEKRTPTGVYFYFSPESGIKIANFTTQTTFYESRLEGINIPSFQALADWLQQYVATTSDQDLIEIAAFQQAKRERIALKEGDFFRFRIARNLYGFGRILMDIRKLRKEKDFRQPNGLANLMGQPLLISIYHYLSAEKEVAIEKFNGLKRCPSQYLMDNRLFYGEYDIIGHKPLTAQDLDCPISYSASISGEPSVYLQWGLIYLSKSKSSYQQWLNAENPFVEKTSPSFNLNNPYRKESIGYNLDLNKPILEACIKADSNAPYWNQAMFIHHFDLRNPKNRAIKEALFEAFGIDPNLTYTENARNIRKI